MTMADAIKSCTWYYTTWLHWQIMQQFGEMLLWNSCNIYQLCSSKILSCATTYQTMIHSTNETSHQFISQSRSTIINTSTPCSKNSKPLCHFYVHHVP